MTSISTTKEISLKLLPSIPPDPISPSDSFQVFVRVRPLNPKELSLLTSKKKPNIIKKKENMVKIL